MLEKLIGRFRKSGFDGPYYQGGLGKLRFAAESTLWRREIIFSATPVSFGAVPPPDGPPLELHRIRRFEDLEPFRTGLDDEYYPGYIDGWRGPFTWGERAVIGTVDGKVASFNFMQVGEADGFPTYYGRLFEDEGRLLRGGVAPSFRRQGLNTLMKHRLMQELFDSGVRRIYAESYLYNVPTLRTLIRLGFRAIGKITVIELRPWRNFVRWAPVDGAVRELAAHGIDLTRAPGSPAAAAVGSRERP